VVSSYLFLKSRIWWHDVVITILKRAVAGLKTAHLLKITLAFEFSVLTLTVPGLRSEKFKNPACF
jgi:hypothetical protein